MPNTTKEIPYISHMITVQVTDYNHAKKLIDNSYYNANLDSECEYCMNTTAWD